MRVGAMAESMLLEPQAASKAAVAQVAATKLRRIQFAAMYISRFKSARV